MKIFRVSTVPQSLNILLKGQLKFLNETFEITAISTFGKHLIEVEEREKVKIHSISMERKISLLKDIISLWRLYFYFKKTKPDIIHSITPKAGLLSMIAGKFAGVPVRMHTFTGLIFPYKKGVFQKLLIIMDRLLCWAATHVYPEGNGVKYDLIKYNITSKPLKVIANGNVNGVDLEYFNPTLFSDKEKKDLKSSLGIQEQDFVFVFVGRLVRDKGINELIEAFCLLKIPNVKLLLVGSFEQELDPLKQNVFNEIKNNSNIIHVGFQKDVRPYFAVSNALVFPSYREGFPNVVLQAGAMSIPSIVTNISGCNEIITDGFNGIVIEAKNSNSIYNGMKLILNDITLYNKFQKNSRHLIQEKYEQKIVWEALKEEYLNIISNKKNV